MKKSTLPMNKETPERITNGGCSSSILPTSFYDKRWFKAASLLRADPSLMTSKILIVGLKNKAPLHVIKFFLSINPNAAGIPRDGPTPLQVAVEYNASKEVVKELLQACPFALVVTTSAEWLDPLTYARRNRSTETELIALLSRPLGSWIHPKEREEADRREAQEKAPPTPMDIPIPVPPMPPAPLPRAARKQEPTSDFSTADKHELQNVKRLCLTVMKGQKRLIQEVGKVKNSVERNSPAAAETEAPGKKDPPKAPEVTIQHVLDLEEKQKRNLKAHLIALDMKEQAMRAYVSRMENKILQSLEVTKHEYVTEKYEDRFNNLNDQLHSAARRMDNFVGTLEHRMVDFDVRMDHEAKVNALFRSGIQHHVGVTQQDVSQQEGFEIISLVEPRPRGQQHTPFVFATPYRKPDIDEEAPLCPKESPLEEKEPGTCLWPRFLSRRRDRAPSLR